MKNNKSNELDSDKIASLLFRLAFPAFVGMFVMTLYNVVDAVFVGHFVGSKGLAALAVVFPIQMLAAGIGQMTGMGGASLVSRQIGAKDLTGAEKTLGNSISSTFIISGGMMIAGLVWMEPCLLQLGTSEAVLPYAKNYMQIILFGLFFQTFAMLLSTLIRAEGNARVPMIGMIIGACLNTGLDAYFVIVLDMGIKGAALATIVGESVSTLYFLRYYFSGKNYLRLKWAGLKFEKNILIGIFSIGISAFAMSMATSISALFINRVCLAFGGDIAVSVFGIINRIIMFAQMPGIVIGMGLQPIVGFNYGADRYDRIMRAVVISVGAATFFCTVSFVLMFFWPEFFISLFTPDKELIDLGGHAARILFSGIYTVGFIIVGSTVFQALGLVKQSFVTSVARPVLFLIPLVYVLPGYMHLNGVWTSFPLTDLLTFLLTLLLFIPRMKLLVGRHRAILKQIF